MRGIVWLASYPKSGNTWFRTFLANYLRDGDRPVDINSIGGAPIASARRPFDEALGYDSGELSFDEIDALRPEIYAQIAREATETLYCKTHDAYTFLPDGRPLLPPEATDRALYFVRNPLDVVVSFAHHSALGAFDRMIDGLANEKNSFCEVSATEPNQLRQKLLSWSSHVRSWMEAPGVRVQVVRYEDMKRAPEETFGNAVRFLGLPEQRARLEKAIAFSRFEELRAQEEKVGFREKMPRAKSFFRKGEVGSWREALTTEQAQRVVTAHADVMRRLGYLHENGEIVF